MHPPRTTPLNPTPSQQAAARGHLLLVDTQDLLASLNRHQLPSPARLQDANAAPAQATQELHAQAGNQPGQARRHQARG